MFKLVGLGLGACLLVSLSISPVLAGQWVPVAEAWTAPDERSTITAAQRMFSAPDLTDICPRTPVPKRLVAPTRVTVERGRAFDVSGLRVRATDEAGQTAAPVPIVIEAADADREWFDRGTETPGASLVIRRTGRFRLRARTICPPAREAVISIVASER